MRTASAAGARRGRHARTGGRGPLLRRPAVHVDQVLRHQEIAPKHIGPQLARVPGIAGATVLGNGETVLLNPLQLDAGRSLPTIAPQASAQRPADSPPCRIMVVDDSLTVRRLTGRLAREGYHVSIAKDGVDAPEQMHASLPDLIFLDIEMPRMDGFELTRHVRADPRMAAVPIVLVTSRLAEKHQQRAVELGVNAFFGKPYPEDELLACVADLLGPSGAVRAA